MKIEKSTLSNGLVHLHVQKKDSEVSTVIFMVGVGSKYEEKRISGISHYLEHMFFKGTKKRKNSREIAEFIESVGGSFNAFTGKEYTGYYAVVSKQHTDRAFDFVSDLVTHATFPEDEMEKEKGVVVEEMNMYQDIPMKLVGEKFEEVLYGDTPAGRQIIGTKETVMGLTHQDIVDYVKRHYNTKNGVVVTVGSMNKAEAQESAEKYFSEIPEGEQSSKESVVEKQDDINILLTNKKTDQTHLCLGYRSASLNDDDYYPLSIAAAVLGGGMSSRLFNEIREKRGLCYYVKSMQDSYSDSGYFYIQAGIDNTKIEEALRAMMEEIKKMKEHGVTQDEFTKAKEFLKGKLALSLEGSQETAVHVAEQYLIENSVETIEDKWAKIDEVEFEDIKRVVDQYLVEKHLNLAMIGPYSDTEKFKKILKSGE